MNIIKWSVISFQLCAVVSCGTVKTTPPKSATTIADGTIPAHHHRMLKPNESDPTRVSFSVRVEKSGIQVGDSQWFRVTVLLDHIGFLKEVGKFDVAMVENGNILLTSPLQHSVGYMDRDGDKLAESYLTTLGSFIVDRRSASSCQVLFSTDHIIDAYQWAVSIADFVPTE